MPSGVQQNVVRLQVPVHDPHAVEVLERQNELGQVKARHVLLEGLVALQNVVEVPARHVLHHEADEVVVGELEQRLHDELAGHDGVDVALGLQVVELVFVRVVEEIDYFHRVEVPGLLSLHEPDFPEAALVYQLDEVEVVDADVLAGAAAFVARAVVDFYAGVAVVALGKERAAVLEVADVAFRVRSRVLAFLLVVLLVVQLVVEYYGGFGVFCEDLLVESVGPFVVPFKQGAVVFLDDAVLLNGDADRVVGFFFFFFLVF